MKRLDELAKLEDGWLDGEAIAPSKERLKWLQNVLDARYPSNLLQPYFYPTPDGNVQIEWDLGKDEDISIEVNLATGKATWFWINFKTDEHNRQRLDLYEDWSWEWIKSELRTRSSIG